MALRNAREKAEVIAAHLNLKVDKVINIDDDTSVRSLFDPAKPADNKRSDELYAILASLEESLALFGGMYLLRVTFALKE